MCDRPHECWLVKNPHPWFGNFKILTRQYNEIVQWNKEYILWKTPKNAKLKERFIHCQTVYLPCGKCIQCLVKRSNSWTLRSSLELQKYDKACVLTLTYRDSDLPENGNLNYKDVQLFLKKLRNRTKQKIKMMCCCEYGSKTLRPHYHIILFNYFPDDIPKIGDQLKWYKRTRKGSLLFKSKFLENLWSHGFVDVGLVNHQTCRYVSQYCCKKVFKTSKDYVDKIKEAPEKLVCSVGFGLDWFLRNYRAVIDSGKIILGGFTFSIPRYFIKKLEFINKPLFDKYKEKLHNLFLNYNYDSEEQKRMLARSDRLKQKFGIFHTFEDSKEKLDFLHNKYYQHQKSINGIIKRKSYIE